MPNYLLRVQLSVETDRNYTMLRDRLLAAGYTKRIKDKTGVEWRLPNGNYYVVSLRTLDSLMKVTRQIIDPFDAKAQVLLVEAPKGQMTWHGLQRC